MPRSSLHGDLTAFERILKERGFREALMTSPVPHCHHYHAEFDVAETELLEYWEWECFPQTDSDDR